MVKCKDPNSPKCENPSIDKESCELSGGNCDGYADAGSEGQCACKFVGKGCAIDKPAPKGEACHCDILGDGKCKAFLVKCKDPQSPKCLNPSTDAESCKLSGGNCDGYASNA